MIKFVFYNLILICATIIFSSLIVKAQKQTNLDGETDAAQTRQPNLLQEFNLTADQIRQIRRINQDRKINRPPAVRRLKAAREALDQAIYGENDNESEIQARMRDVHASQLEVLKERVSYEQSLRRVLTAQQFARFRQLQRQFNQRKDQNPGLGNGLNTIPNRKLTPRRLRLQRQQNRQQQRLNP